MRVCLDTNVLVQLFGTRPPFAPILDGLIDGRLELAVSTEILLEYEETITNLSGLARWQKVELFLHQTSRLHRNIFFIEPHFRFGVVTQDPDDDKFVDCAIAAGTDFIITWDHHFDTLMNAGYKPKPITHSGGVHSEASLRGSTGQVEESENCSKSGLPSPCSSVE